RRNRRLGAAARRGGRAGRTPGPPAPGRHAVLDAHPPRARDPAAAAGRRRRRRRRAGRLLAEPVGLRPRRGLVRALPLALRRLAPAAPRLPRGLPPPPGPCGAPDRARRPPPPPAPPPRR